MKITHSWRHHELWFSAIYGKDSIYMYSDSTQRCARGGRFDSCGGTRAKFIVKKLKTKIMENLEFWNKLKGCPDEAKKQIVGGRLKGFTDVNPVWRMRIMTETFGMCGFGWKYEITKQWNEQYGDVVKTFCNINLYIKVDGEWSEPIPATGGSQFADKSYVSDENHKMALTDALSVAMKSLGVAAEVYWDKARDWETKYSVNKSQPKMSTSAPASNDSRLDLTPTEQFKQIIQPAIVQSNTNKELELLFNAYKDICKDVQGYKEAFTKRKEEIIKQEAKSI